MKHFFTLSVLLFVVLGAAQAQQRVVVTLSDDHLSMDENGDRWKVYEVDSLYIFLNVRKVHSHGSYFLIDLYLQNNSHSEQTFSFSDASVSTFKKTNSFLTEKKYLRRVRRGKFWKTFGLASAAVTTSVVTQAVIENSFPDPFERSLGTEILHDVVSIAAQGLISVGTAAVASNFAEDYAKCVQNNVGYLKDYSLAPDNAVRGHAYVKYIKKSGDVLVNIPIGPHIYAFKWTASQLRQSR